MPAHFLAKTEPHTYSIDSFRADVRTTWDGVTNFQAVRTIREMQREDKVFIYHSGASPAVVGVAKVVSEPRTDPSNPKSAIVDLEYVQHLDPPTPLAEIKASGKFADWALIRQSRLSTMAAPPDFVAWMRSRYPDAQI